MDDTVALPAAHVLRAEMVLVPREPVPDLSPEQYEAGIVATNARLGADLDNLLRASLGLPAQDTSGLWQQTYTDALRHAYERRETVEGEVVPERPAIAPPE